MNKNHRQAKVATALVAVAIAAYFTVTRGFPTPLRSITSSQSIAVQREATGLGQRDSTPPVARVGAEDRDVTRVREAILGAIVAAHAEPPAAPTETDPVVRARERLDERMANAPPNPDNAARMEAALQAVIDSAALGDTTAVPICGSTICRVDLSNGDDARVEKSTATLLQRAPKMFASTLVYPNGAGGRVMYLTTNAPDLLLDAPPAGSAMVMKADGPPPVR